MWPTLHHAMACTVKRSHRSEMGDTENEQNGEESCGGSMALG